MKYDNAFASFAVKDLDAAQSFYEGTLGIDVEKLDMGILRFDLDGTSVMVYPKPDHEPANFTVLNFAVTDLDATVDELTNAGVVFERYEGFEMDDKNIARGQGPDIAWFKDPSGNIVSVLEESN